MSLCLCECKRGVCVCANVKGYCFRQPQQWPWIPELLHKNAGVCGNVVECTDKTWIPSHLEGRGLGRNTYTHTLVFFVLIVYHTQPWYYLPTELFHEIFYLITCDVRFWLKCFAASPSSVHSRELHIPRQICVFFVLKTSVLCLYVERFMRSRCVNYYLLVYKMFVNVKWTWK